tara:strand:- start:1901 stop:2131 length:231 start_codon:yes stop_codon:yes gene_type:complete
MYNRFGNMQSVSDHVSNIMSRGEDFKNDSESKLEEIKEQVMKAQEFVDACDGLMSDIRDFEALKSELERDYEADLD